jgi:uncharacterized membrane protein YdjX (TVP38/TMEM64 family)
VKRNQLSVFFNLGALSAFVLVGGAVAWSYLEGGLMAVVFSPEIEGSEKIEALRDYCKSWGPWAPIAYIGFVTAEVLIAPLPGLMLYAPGGVLFGGFLGGLYSLIGNVLGAAIACRLARMICESRFGRGLRRALRPLEPMLERRGIWVVFFLRVNPLTSSDLVSYAAGLARMPVWKVVAGTALGMAPLCWLQSYLAQGLMQAFPGLVYPLVVACIVYGCVVVWILRRLAIQSTVPAEA